MENKIKFDFVSEEQRNKVLKEFMAGEGYPNLEDEYFNTFALPGLPKRATAFSAGYDCFSPVSFCLDPGEAIKVPTLLKAYMPPDVVLMAYPRSGQGFKFFSRLANTVGIIDSDYVDNETNEGHIVIKIRNEGDLPLKIHAGDAFCQFIFQHYLLTDDDDFSGEKRNGGFGSTSKK